METKAISRRNKIWAISLIALTMGSSIGLTDLHLGLKWMLVAIGLGLSYFIGSRPEGEREVGDAGQDR